MELPKLARRAAELPGAFPGAHFPTELDPDVILFDSGFAFPHLLPDLTGYAQEALTRHRAECLQYAPSQGHPELRAWIAQYMNDDGCQLGPENIFIVHGAKNGLDLICRLLIDPGDGLIVSAPTYFTALPIFRSHGAELIEVPQDADGMAVAALDQRLDHRERAGHAPAKLIYDVTDFHNPSGLCMPRSRREQLLDVATRRGLFLVEDNPYRRVRFESAPVPTLAALDRSGRVLHVGTFSKLIAPGLRLGWIAGPTPLIARLMQLKADGGSNPLIQRIVLDFCTSPAFKDHVRKVQATYREHRDLMVAAVRRDLPGVTLTVPGGGYYLWLTLPPAVDGDELARRAHEAGVHVIPGTRFFAGTDEQLRAQGRRHLRLSYSYATLEQIEEGIRRLARIYESQSAA
jgi:2-aminoadipate transaminase